MKMFLRVDRIELISDPTRILVMKLNLHGFTGFAGDLLKLKTLLLVHRNV